MTAPTPAPDMRATPLGRRWGLRLLLGVIQVIGGILAIAVPVAASIAAVAIFGAVLLVTGAMQLYQALSSRPLKGGVLQALGAALYLIAALLVLLFPLSGALTLTIVVAILLIADGVVRTMFAYQLRLAEGWGWLLAAGIASTVVGVLLLIGWPLTGIWAVGILFGASLLFSGLTQCVLAIMQRTRIARSASQQSVEGAHRHA